MIKTIYICDKCKKQKTEKRFQLLPIGWLSEHGGEKHYCSKKCKPRRPKIYVDPNNDSDPGVGALYGRT